MPNTIDMALLPSKEVRAIVHAKAPYPVVHINEAWSRMYNLHQSKAEGLPLSDIIAAPKPQMDQLTVLANECAAGKPVSAVALVHNRNDPSEPALIYVKIFPLASGMKTITHLLVVQTDLPLLPAEVQAVRQHVNHPNALLNADGIATNVRDIRNMSRTSDDHPPTTSPSFDHDF